MYNTSFIIINITVQKQVLTFLGCSTKAAISISGLTSRPFVYIIQLIFYPIKILHYTNAVQGENLILNLCLFQPRFTGLKKTNDRKRKWKSLLTQVTKIVLTQNFFSKFEVFI